VWTCNTWRVWIVVKMGQILGLLEENTHLVEIIWLEENLSKNSILARNVSYCVQTFSVLDKLFKQVQEMRVYPTIWLWMLVTHK